MPRDPRTPDCGIRGCERAEYRAGLCRKHYGLVPFETRMLRAAEQMMETHNRAQRRKRAVVREVQARIDAA